MAVSLICAERSKTSSQSGRLMMLPGFWGIKTTFHQDTAMLNKAMERKLETDEAIDLADYPREGRYYVLDEDAAYAAALAGMDFCDARTEEWIWSIGQRHSDGAVLASTRADLYDNPYFKCLWRR